MATFVLVHGAYGGAHGWHKVRPLLWAMGHQTFTPSLTGIGERAHLASPQVTLSTHIQDVVNCVEYEDLRDIVLVGFSYGGNVITSCVDLIADRIAHMVYLDAALRKNGEPGSRTEPLSHRMGQEWLLEGPPRVYDDPAEGAWAAPRRSGQPLGTLIESVRISKPLEEHAFTRTYIKATASNHEVPGISRNTEYTQNHPAWRYREIETTHMVPNNRPDELVELLLEVIGEPEATARMSERKLAGASAVPSLMDQRLVGTWDLVRNEHIGPDGGRSPDRFDGGDAQIMYAADGRMSVVLTRAGRRPLMENAPAEHSARFEAFDAVDVERQAELFKASTSFWGTWKVDASGAEVVQVVLGHSNPDSVGSELPRRFSFDGDELILLTPVESDGGYSELVWRRVR